MEELSLSSSSISLPKTSHQQKISPPETGKIEIGQQGVSKIVKVIFQSPESVNPSLVSIGNLIGAGITGFGYTKTSRSFLTEATHSVSDLVQIWQKSYYGDDVLIAGAKNIARKEVLANEEDYAAAAGLKKICESMKEEFEQENGKIIAFDEKLESQKIGGICAGLSIDTAFRHLILEEPILTIIKSNEKGASAEAAANQAVHDAIEVTANPFGAWMNDLLTHLGDISKSKKGHDLCHIDFNAVGRAFVISDGEVERGEEYEQIAKKYDDQCLGENTRGNEFIELMQGVMTEECNKAYELSQKSPRKGTNLLLRNMSMARGIGS